jgi:hypothetical protein
MSEGDKSGFRFSLKWLLVAVAVASAFLAGYRLGYETAATKAVVEMVNEGWIPPKPNRAN